jgi:uncharacterized protein with GYD domain
MQKYISLVSFTEEGFKHLKETAKRARAFRENAQKKNVNIRETFWTLGQYDLVHLFEAPDHDTAAAVGFALGSMGKVRTVTLHAFTEDEVSSILSVAYDLHVDSGSLNY